MEPALRVFKKSPGDSSVQQSVRNSDLDGAGQVLFISFLFIGLQTIKDDADFYDQYKKTHRRVGGIGGEWKESLRVKFPVCVRCIIFIIRHPRLGLQTRRFSLGHVGHVVCAPQLWDGRAVNEIDMWQAVGGNESQYCYFQTNFSNKAFLWSAGLGKN